MDRSDANKSDDLYQDVMEFDDNDNGKVYECCLAGGSEDGIRLDVELTGQERVADMDFDERDGQRRSLFLDNDGGAYFDASHNMETVVRRTEAVAWGKNESGLVSDEEIDKDNDILFDPAQKLNFDNTDDFEDNEENVKFVNQLEFEQEDRFYKESDEEDDNSDSLDGSNYLNQRPRLHGSEDGALSVPGSSHPATSVSDQGQNIRIIEGHDSSLLDDGSVAGGIGSHTGFAQAQVVGLPMTTPTSLSSGKYEDDSDADNDGQHIYDSLDREDGTSPFGLNTQRFDVETSEYYSSGSLNNVQAITSLTPHMEMASSPFNEDTSVFRNLTNPATMYQNAPLSSHEQIDNSCGVQPNAFQMINVLKESPSGTDNGICSAVSSVTLSQDGIELCEEGLLQSAQPTYAQPVTTSTNPIQDAGDFKEILGDGTEPLPNKLKSELNLGTPQPNTENYTQHLSDGSLQVTDTDKTGSIKNNVQDDGTRSTRQAAAGSSISWTNHNQSAKPKTRPGSVPRKRVTPPTRQTESRRPAVQGSASSDISKPAMRAQSSNAPSSAGAKAGKNSQSSVGKTARVEVQGGEKSSNASSAPVSDGGSRTGTDISTASSSLNNGAGSSLRYLRPYQATSPSKASLSASMGSIGGTNSRVRGVGKESHHFNQRHSNPGQTQIQDLQVNHGLGHHRQDMSLPLTGVHSRHDNGVQPGSSGSFSLYSESSSSTALSSSIQPPQAELHNPLVVSSSNSSQISMPPRAQQVSNKLHESVPITTNNHAMHGAAPQQQALTSEAPHNSYNTLHQSHPVQIQSSHLGFYSQHGQKQQQHQQPPSHQHHYTQQQQLLPPSHHHQYMQQQPLSHQQQYMQQQQPLSHQQQYLQQQQQQHNSFLSASGQQGAVLSPTGSDGSHHSYGREMLVTAQAPGLKQSRSSLFSEIDNGESSMPGMEEVRSHINSMLHIAADNSMTGGGYGGDTASELLAMDQPVNRQLQFDLESSSFHGNNGQEDMSDILENFPTFSSKIFSELSGVAHKSDSLTHVDSQQLRETLEKERYRRKHCEEQIQRLNAKLLETQQQLAVAVSTDKRKDLMIEQLDKQLAKVVEGWKRREAEKDSMLKTLRGEKESVEESLSQHQMMINNFERDLAQTVGELREEREKSTGTIEHLKSELGHSKELKEEMEMKLASAMEKCDKMAAEWDALAKARANAEELAEKAQDTLVKEEMSWKQRESDLTAKITEVKEANQTVINMEKVKLEEEKKKREDMEKEAVGFKTELDKLFLDVEQMARERESQKVEMSIMEAKFETGQRKLEADLHAEMEKEIARQAEDYHNKLESSMEEANERHRKQVSDLLARHKHDLDRQMTSASEELNSKDQEHKAKMSEMEERLAESRNEISSLKQSKLKLESQRMEILSKLQFMMQSQWNEAVSLLVSTPQRKGLSNSFMSSQSSTTSSSVNLLPLDAAAAAANNNISLAASLNLASTLALSGSVPSQHATNGRANDPLRDEGPESHAEESTSPGTESCDNGHGESSASSMSQAQVCQDAHTLNVAVTQGLEGGGSEEEKLRMDRVEEYVYRMAIQGSSPLMTPTRPDDTNHSQHPQQFHHQSRPVVTSPRDGAANTRAPTTVTPQTISTTTSSSATISAVVHHSSFPEFTATAIKSPQQLSRFWNELGLQAHQEIGMVAPPPSAVNSGSSLNADNRTHLINEHHQQHTLHQSSTAGSHRNNRLSPPQHQQQQQQLLQLQQQQQLQHHQHSQQQHQLQPQSPSQLYRNHQHQQQQLQQQHHQLPQHHPQQQDQLEHEDVLLQKRLLETDRLLEAVEKKGKITAWHIADVDNGGSPPRISLPNGSKSMSPRMNGTSQPMSPPVKQSAPAQHDLNGSGSDTGNHLPDPNRIQASYSHLTEQVDAHMNRQEELQHYIQMLLQKAPGNVNTEPERDSFPNDSDILESSRDLTVDLDMTETSQALEMTRQMSRLQELRERQQRAGKKTQPLPPSAIPTAIVTAPANNNNLSDSFNLQPNSFLGQPGVLTSHNLSEISQLLAMYREQWEESPESANQDNIAGQLVEALRKANPRLETKVKPGQERGSSGSKDSPRGQAKGKKGKPGKDNFGKNRWKVGYQPADSSINSTDSGQNGHAGPVSGTGRGGGSGAVHHGKKGHASKTTTKVWK